MIMIFNNDFKGFVCNDLRIKEFMIKIIYLFYLIWCFYIRVDKIYIFLNINRYDYDEKFCLNCELVLGFVIIR